MSALLLAELHSMRLLESHGSRGCGGVARRTVRGLQRGVRRKNQDLERTPLEWLARGAKVGSAVGDNQEDGRKEVFHETIWIRAEFS